ncbi:MAG: type II toxin-antitoxin system RelE/ParE family toxin [Deltaproteobacteria bacterium]|nr:MAG: type II toxin-antitoxin system RelE/ParE family toxin [Deltaproteobacteria bacterium]
MKALIVRRAAERDAEEARDWYEEEAELGEAFVDELGAAMSRLRSLSERFPEVRPGIRRSLMNRFPYAIYFSVRSDAVVVLAILHQRRGPGTLHRRLSDEEAV